MLCGYFYCLAIYVPSEITEWVDEDQTAMCAKCGIDSVIGAASGYPVTAEFLQRRCASRAGRRCAVHPKKTR